jgi:hypothetical protein
VDDLTRLNELRELFLNAPESSAARLAGIAASLALAAIVLVLVRRRKLREEYTPIWMAVAGALMVLSFNLDLLRAITRAVGAWTYSSTIFFLGELFLVVICLNFAVRLSTASTQLKNLGQEIALLRARLDERDAGAAPPAPGDRRPAV